MVQNVQDRQSQGYTGNAGNNQASGAWVINKDEEQQDFLANSLEETDDGKDLQLQATTNFKADHIDEYDSDCNDEAIANVNF
ncbi:hypothetical protein Tco_1419035 [Tanacetum coccineum]